MLVSRMAKWPNDSGVNLLFIFTNLLPHHKSTKNKIAGNFILFGMASLYLVLTYHVMSKNSMQQKFYQETTSQKVDRSSCTSRVRIFFFFFFSQKNSGSSPGGGNVL